MFQVLNALQGNVFPGTRYHWWGGKQDLEWAPLARQEGIGKSSYFVPGQLWPNNTYNTSNLGNNINKLRLEINYQARFSSERAAAWLLFDLQAEMTDAARCYLYVPALVACLGHSEYPSWEHPGETTQSFSSCLQKSTTDRSTHWPAPRSPAASLSTRQSSRGHLVQPHAPCSLPNGCPYPSPGNKERHSQLSQEKYYQLGLIFTVLKLTLANVIAWCTDLSNLFSAAVPKHIIIVCCVSKAGLGFHVTVL